MAGPKKRPFIFYPDYRLERRATPDAPARKLKLPEAFSRFVGLFEDIFKLIRFLVIIAVVLYFTVLLVRANRAGHYYISETNVPARLLQKGLNGKLVQSMVLERLRQITQKANLTSVRLFLEKEEPLDFDLDYEGFHLSKLLTWLLPARKFIKSDIYLAEYDQLRISCTLNKATLVSDPGVDSLTDYQALDILTFKMATAIIGRLSPRLLAAYRFKQSDFHTSLAEIDTLLIRPQDREDKASLYNFKGNCLSAMGDTAAAESAYRKALGVVSPANEFYVQFDRGSNFVTGDTLNTRRQIRITDRLAGNDSVKIAYVFFLKGQLHTVEGKYRYSLDDFNRALKYQPKNRDYLYYVAAALAANGRYDDASRRFDQALQHRQDKLLTDAYTQIGFFSPHEQILPKLIAASQAKPPFVYGIYAEAVYQLGKQPDDREIAKFKKILALRPDFWPAWYQLACLYRHQQDYDSAVFMLAKADRLIPYQVDAYEQMIADAFVMGDVARAENLGRELISHHPLDSYCLAMEGEINSIVTRKFKEAEYYFNLALLVSPDNLRALNLYAEHKKRWKDWHGLISLRHRILELNPADTAAVRDIVEANTKSGNNAYAERLRRSIMTDNEKTIEEQLALARDALQRKDNVAAFRHYKIVTGIAESKEAFRNVAQYYFYVKKDASHAKSYFSRLKRFSSLNEKEEITYGECLFMTHDYQRELAEIKNAYKLAPTDCSVYGLWAAALRDVGMDPATDLEFQNALKKSNCTPKK